MKLQMIFATALTLLPLISQAAVSPRPLHCNGSAGDSGYILDVAADQKTAKLTAETISGPTDVEFGDLECQRAKAATAPGADEMHALLICRTPNVADAGFSVTISSGGFWFHTEANISEDSFVGSRVVQANILCK